MGREQGGDCMNWCWQSISTLLQRKEKIGNFACPWTLPNYCEIQNKVFIISVILARTPTAQTSNHSLRHRNFETPHEVHALHLISHCRRCSSNIGASNFLTPSLFTSYHLIIKTFKSTVLLWDLSMSYVTATIKSSATDFVFYLHPTIRHEHLTYLWTSVALHNHHRSFARRHIKSGRHLWDLTSATDREIDAAVRTSWSGSRRAFS